MNATGQLHDLGQSLWLDNITRGLLTSGTLSRYIGEFTVTGLTSNPTIFDHAVKNGDFYDEAIRKKALAGESGEALLFELALADLTQAADLFRPIFDATGGVDGWVSLEVSPFLADDTAGTIRAAAQLHARAQRPNLFIKIPGIRAGFPAIEETIFAGVPVNVTLLFSREHYIAAAEAYMRGIERRIAAGRGLLGTGTKDPAASDVLYVEVVLAEFYREGVNDEALAANLQREGTAAFAKSWRDLMFRIGSKSQLLTETRQAETARDH